MSDTIWAPSPERVERANLTRLARRLGADGYHDLHRMSLEEPERFWPALVDDLGIDFSQRWGAVVDASYLFVNSPPLRACHSIVVKIATFCFVSASWSSAS